MTKKSSKGPSQTQAPAVPLAQPDAEALLRWRLALGPEAEKVAPELSLGGLGQLSGVGGVDEGRLGDFDQALGFVYDDERRGGTGASRPYLPKWLGLLREFFAKDVVALVQKDAIDRKGLTELLFEPETLPYLEKNVDLVATLLSARGLVPDKAKDIARQIVREVVDDLRKQLESEVRTSLLGAARRSHDSPLKIARNLDWKRTINKNLRGWDREHKRLVPERVYFWANQRRRHDWEVVIAVDQSGSMGQSVVYSSVMGAIFASIDVLQTRLLFFDTEIVDVTPLLVDPVEVLFASQLGGGTDINRAVAYVQTHFIERPEKTIFLLITDLYEGGNATELVARVRELCESKVKVLVLLALTDGGKPSYDHNLAAQIAALGAHCFGCTPRLLVRVVERIMKGQDPGGVIREHAAGGERA
ncbi:MAG TPA: VWA domain-containing protein [Kofleriaceae bacterium]|nr:VWA domain-containing protein [Kofleriaceae bacterium]